MKSAIGDKLKKPTIKEINMTICIGCICEDSKILIASDRKITANYPPIEFEHETRKQEILSPTCIALTADSALAHTELFRDVKNKLKGKSNPTIREIAKLIKESFVELRRQKAEEIYLKPRGMNLEQFYRCAQQLPPDIVITLDSQIFNLKYPLIILLCGVDEEGAHIYRIFDPGVSECFDSLGFNAIGSGELHAVSNFIAHKCCSKTQLHKAIYVTYESKKMAEQAPGVGVTTDIILVDNKGIKILDSHLTTLDGIHQKRIKKLDEPEIGEMKEIINSLYPNSKERVQRKGVI